MCNALSPSKFMVIDLNSEKFGKTLAVLGAILSLAGLWFLTWINGYGVVYTSAWNGMSDLMNLNVDVTLSNIIFGTPLANWMAYIFAAVIILISISWLLTAIGIKLRLFAFFGGLLTLTPFVILILASLLDVTIIDQLAALIYSLFTTGAPFPVLGQYIPYTLVFDIPSFPITLGLAVSVVGGLISLISSFIPRVTY
jgi:hypothetical protein